MDQKATRKCRYGVMAVEQKTTTNSEQLERSNKFFQEVATELKKTTWPTRQEAIRLTSVVVAVIVALGLYMGVLDAVLSFLVNKFSLIK